jgi:hypothetical protein
MDREDPDSEAILTAFRSSLKRAMAEHRRMFEILLSRQVALPLEIGELLEDAGNHYFAMSESVSEKFLVCRRGKVK